VTDVARPPATVTPQVQPWFTPVAVPGRMGKTLGDRAKSGARACRATFALAAALAAVLLLPGAVRAADGAALFTAHCAMCHADPHAANPEVKIGPPLDGIVGRKAGTQPGYTRYSKALKASGKVWTDANLAAYMAAPMELIPGTTMALVGITSPADRATLVAYLNAAPAR
jgi:cytochrome c2